MASSSEGLTSQKEFYLWIPWGKQWFVDVRSWATPLLNPSLLTHCQIRPPHIAIICQHPPWFHGGWPSLARSGLAKATAIARDFLKLSSTKPEGTAPCWYLWLVGVCYWSESTEIFSVSSFVSHPFSSCPHRQACSETTQGRAWYLLLHSPKPE